MKHDNIWKIIKEEIPPEGGKTRLGSDCGEGP